MICGLPAGGRYSVCSWICGILSYVSFFLRHQIQYQRGNNSSWKIKWKASTKRKIWWTTEQIYFYNFTILLILFTPPKTYALSHSVYDANRYVNIVVFLRLRFFWNRNSGRTVPSQYCCQRTSIACNLLLLIDLLSQSIEKVAVSHHFVRPCC